MPRAKIAVQSFCILLPCTPPSKINLIESSESMNLKNIVRHNTNDSRSISKERLISRFAWTSTKFARSRTPSVTTGTGQSSWLHRGKFLAARVRKKRRRDERDREAERGAERTARAREKEARGSSARAKVKPPGPDIHIHTRTLTYMVKRGPLVPRDPAALISEKLLGCAAETRRDVTPWARECYPRRVIEIDDRGRRLYSEVYHVRGRQNRGRSQRWEASRSRSCRWRPTRADEGSTTGRSLLPTDWMEIEWVAISDGH